MPRSYIYIAQPQRPHNLDKIIMRTSPLATPTIMSMETEPSGGLLLWPAASSLTRLLAEGVLPAAHGVLQDLKRVRLEAEDASLRHLSLAEKLYHDGPLVQSVEDLRDLRRAADCHSRHAVRGSRAGRAGRLDAAHSLAHPTPHTLYSGVGRFTNSSDWHPPGVPAPLYSAYSDSPPVQVQPQLSVCLRTSVCN